MALAGLSDQVSLKASLPRAVELRTGWDTHLPERQVLGSRPSILTTVGLVLVGD